MMSPHQVGVNTRGRGNSKRQIYHDHILLDPPQSKKERKIPQIPPVYFCCIIYTFLEIKTFSLEIPATYRKSIPPRLIPGFCVYTPLLF